VPQTFLLGRGGETQRREQGGEKEEQETSENVLSSKPLPLNNDDSDDAPDS
jgi:hypothetical protein